jgi:hypothetical protein
MKHKQLMPWHKMLQEDVLRCLNASISCTSLVRTFHDFFGMEGSHNEINLVLRSTVFAILILGHAP